MCTIGHDTPGSLSRLRDLGFPGNPQTVGCGLKRGVLLPQDRFLLAAAAPDAISSEELAELATDDSVPWALALQLAHGNRLFGPAWALFSSLSLEQRIDKELTDAWRLAHHATVLRHAAARNQASSLFAAFADAGVGLLLYTFPAGVYAAQVTHMDITSGVMTGNTNAAELGIGSVIAVGDVATLTTATWEDYILGTPTIADVSTFVKELSAAPTGGAPFLFEAGGSHAVYLNLAGVFTAAPR